VDFTNFAILEKSFLRDLRRTLVHFSGVIASHPLHIPKNNAILLLDSDKGTNDAPINPVRSEGDLLLDLLLDSSTFSLSVIEFVLTFAPLRCGCEGLIVGAFRCVLTMDLDSKIKS
jgi:hypothetical protein